MSDFDVSVIVVNYNTPDLLKDFVDSFFYQSSNLELELIVVDVDPSEQTSSEVSLILEGHWGNGNLQYWPIDYNCGYSGACNFASNVASGTVLAFFNSDTRLFDDTLDICYRYMMEREDVAIAGPLQVDSYGLITHAGIFGTNSQPKMVGWKAKNPSAYRTNRDDAISVSGSAYFVKREVWDEMANNPKFLELFPTAGGAMLPTKHYYEETWCSYFARHLGYKVAYVGEAIMVHEWHKSSQLGEVEGRIMDDSRRMFRFACDEFGMDRD